MIKLRIDKIATALDEILGLLPNMLEKVCLDADQENCYLKMWKFYEENNNPEIVRNAPVSFWEKIEFKRNEGYLGILIYKSLYSEKNLPEIFDSLEGINNLSPRGISSAFIKDKNPDIHFDIFIANGRNSGALVKANLITKAFELEHLLNRHPTIISYLFTGITVKSKKARISETIILEPSETKNKNTAFLKWIIKENTDILRGFKDQFFNKDIGKLFMNPF